MRRKPLEVTVTRGDEARIRIAIEPQDPEDATGIAGLSITFQARYRASDSGAPLIDRSTANNGIAIVDAAAGEAEIRLLPGDTSSLPDNATLVFDVAVQAAGATGPQTVIAGGLLHIRKGVIR